jgi:hypothetical protein
MQKFSVVYSARKHGAIGIFYPVRVIVESVDKPNAQIEAFNLLSETYELNGCRDIILMDETVTAEMVGDIREFDYMVKWPNVLI